MRLLYFLAGVKYAIIIQCRHLVQQKYKNLVLAQVLVIAVAAFSAFDIAHNFTSNTVALVFSAIGYAMVVGLFDYLLITSPKTHKVFEILRYVVALANQIISICAIFIFLTGSTLSNKINANRTERIKTIDASYESARQVRWNEYDDLQKSKNDYHEKQCMAQARNGFPGPLYKQVHTACLNNDETLSSIKGQLDVTEVLLKKAYEDERKAIQAETSNDFFIKVEYLPEVLFNNWAKALIAACLSLFMFYLETLAISMKTNIDPNDEYHQKLDEDFKKQNEKQTQKEAIEVVDKTYSDIMDFKQIEAKNAQKTFEFYQELSKQIILNETDYKFLLKIIKTYGFTQSEPILNKMEEALSK